MEGSGGAGAGGRRGRRRAPLRATGWCSRWSTARCRTSRAAPPRARARTATTARRTSRRGTSSQVSSGGRPDGDPARRRDQAPTHHLHVPVRLDGRGRRRVRRVDRRPSGRSTTPTTPCCASSPVRPPRRCRTRALLDQRRPPARRAPPGRPTTSRPATTELAAPPRPSWARPGSARCSTTSATASPASCTTASPSTRSPPGMHIELVRSEIGDDRLRDPARHGQGPHPARGRAAPLGDLRAQRRARRAARTCPSMLRRLSGGAHARRAVGRGAHRRAAGGAARRARAVALPHRGRGAVQHRGARARRAARSCGWRTAPTAGAAHDLRRRRRRPEEVRRSLRAASAGALRRAPRAGEHAGQGPRAGRHRWRSAGPGSAGCRSQVRDPGAASASLGGRQRGAR